MTGGTLDAHVTSTTASVGASHVLKTKKSVSRLSIFVIVPRGRNMRWPLLHVKENSPNVMILVSINTAFGASFINGTSVLGTN